MSRRRLWLLAAAIPAVCLRVRLLWSFPGNYDTESYREVLAILRRGGSVYAETARYNYSPIWWNALRLCDGLGRRWSLPLPTSVGLLLLAVDLLTAALLARMAGRSGSRWPEGAALLFLWNPVSVLLSSWHGQFDNLAILFLVAAVALARREKDGRSVLALAASLLAKHLAWFHPLLFALRKENRHRLATAAVPYALFAASFLPFARDWPGIRRHVLAYGGLGGLYGTDVILLFSGVPFWAPRVLFAAGSLAAIRLLRGVEIGRASLILLIVTLLLVPGIGQQYFVWPIALGSLVPSAGYLIYTVITALFLIGSPRGLGVASPLLPGWYGPWWAALAWLLLEIRGLRARRTA